MERKSETGLGKWTPLNYNTFSINNFDYDPFME
jgi:hypothetical protein